MLASVLPCSVWGAVTLVSLAVVILGAWRIWLEYKRFGRLW